MNRYLSPEWKALCEAQNSPKYSMIDILTITGFMDDAQFLVHVARYTN